jgi:uncharacterized membrane protein YccC
MAPHHNRPPVAEPGVLHLGEHAARAIRDLNHLTRHPDALADPAELSQLLADLATMASRLPQLLDQLHSWLRHEHHAAHLRADTDADPGALATLAAEQLTRAGECARDLAHALDTTHQHLAHLGRPYIEHDDGDGPITETGGQFSPVARGSVFSRC